MDIWWFTILRYIFYTFIKNISKLKNLYTLSMYSFLFTKNTSMEQFKNIQVERRNKVISIHTHTHTAALPNLLQKEGCYESLTCNLSRSPNPVNLSNRVDIEHLFLWLSNMLQNSKSCSVVSDSQRQSMEFSGPEYWSGQPIPYPADLPNPGTEPGSPSLQVNLIQRARQFDRQKITFFLFSFKNTSELALLLSTFISPVKNFFLIFGSFFNRVIHPVIITKNSLYIAGINFIVEYMCQNFLFCLLFIIYR